MDALNAVVLQRVDIGPALMVLQVAPDGWLLPDFKPGQYTTIGLPETAPRAPGTKPPREPAKPGEMIKRAYSIASAPRVRDYMEFYLALVEDGSLTPRLWNLQAGDRLFMSPRVVGTFTLDTVPPDKQIVMISTGTGLGPFMAMLHNDFVGGSARQWALFHGVRSSRDLGYRSELMALQHLNRNFLYVPVISRPQNEPVPWTGTTGYVQNSFTSGLLDQAWGFAPTPDNTHVYICGNPAMIDQTVATLETAGYSEYHHRKNPGGQIHLERYW